MEKVIWTEVASEDIERIWKFYAEKSISAADKVVNKIYATGNNIKFPQQYQVDENLGKPFRRMVTLHFKIIYLEFRGKILITNVFDTRQNPEKMNF